MDKVRDCQEVKDVLGDRGHIGRVYDLAMQFSIAAFKVCSARVLEEDLVVEMDSDMTNRVQRLLFLLLFVCFCRRCCFVVATVFFIFVFLLLLLCCCCCCCYCCRCRCRCFQVLYSSISSLRLLPVLSCVNLALYS